MKEINIHTVYNSEDCVWENRVNGKVNKTYMFKWLAVLRAKDTLSMLGNLLKSLGLKMEIEHLVHNKDGTVKEKNSYGNDPRSIKG